MVTRREFCEKMPAITGAAVLAAIGQPVATLGATAPGDSAMHDRELYRIASRQFRLWQERLGGINPADKGEQQQLISIHCLLDVAADRLEAMGGRTG